jgi:hypothetical protein
VQVTLCCSASPRSANSACAPNGNGTHDSGTNPQRRNSMSGALDMLRSPVRSSSRGSSGGGGGGDLQHESLAFLVSSGRLFRCAHCDCFFSDYSMYAMHQKLHLPDRPFTCCICHEDCRDRVAFSKHLLGHLNYG